MATNTSKTKRTDQAKPARQAERIAELEAERDSLLDETDALVQSEAKAQSRLSDLRGEIVAITADRDRIGGARSAQDAFAAFASMEGRAITAAAIVADMAKRVPAMVEASTRRVCTFPIIKNERDPDNAGS